MINYSTQKSGWLPGNHKIEYNTAMDLLSYAVKKNTYSLDPFVCSNGMDPKDIEMLAKLDIPGLPDACAVAIQLAINHQDTVGGFVVHHWRDNDGHYWQEVQLMDESTEEWEVISLERLA